MDRTPAEQRLFRQQPGLEASPEGPTLADLWLYLLTPSKEASSPGKPEICARLSDTWPPDLFALCAAALRRSGAYAAITDDLIRALNEGDPTVQQMGKEWRMNRDTGTSQLPAEVKQRWNECLDDCDRPIYRVGDNPKLVENLLFLLAAADEASRGLGLPTSTKGRSEMENTADALLIPTQFGSTLCRKISPTAARVLPKVHTAKPGLTIRSFSHHLSYCETDEVQPHWYYIPGARGDVENTQHFNVVVVPWPPEVLPSQIRANESSKKAEPNTRWFQYHPVDSGRKVVEHVMSLCDEAYRKAGSVDAVIMPELSIGLEDYLSLREAVLGRGLLLMAGVGSTAPTGRGENRLCLDVPVSKQHGVHFRQRKHHRWRLDQGQIDQYGLGAKLDRTQWYWEDIVVQDRKMMFLVLRPWLVTSAFICEDLARHDPVGELVRGVGPNLVVALLMDGPQLANRWSSRYAASLADDPGSSVLSVTSLGMSQLSKPLSGESRSRVVALWRDAHFGRPRELELPAGADGLLLTLCCEAEKEYSADGRSDGGNAYTVVLAGCHPLKAQADKPIVPVEQPSEILSGKEASILALLAQQLAEGARLAWDNKQTEPLNTFESTPPRLIWELEGSARAVGMALWEATGDWLQAQDQEHPPLFRHFRQQFLAQGGSPVRKTAVEILGWALTNRKTDLLDNSSSA